jgi:hypothetical protein
MHRKFLIAESELSQQVVAYPDSPAVITGLLQASAALPGSNLLKHTVDLLEKIPNAKLTDTQQFTLATALFYSWSIDYYSGNKQKVKKAQEILYQLWVKNHDPVVGLMLAEVSQDYGYGQDTVVKGLKPTDIVDQLFDIYGGSTVGKEYDKSKADGWKGDPPSVKDVSEENRRILLELVCARGTIYHEKSGLAKIVDGKVIPHFDPYTPDQIAGQHYFDKWFEELTASLGKQLPTGF